MSGMNDDMRLNIEFVKEVEQYPCLYNVRHEEYSNKFAVDKAWNEIRQRFIGSSVSDLKIKWRSVRSSYSRSFRTKKEYYLGQYLSYLIPFSKSKHIEDSLKNSIKKEAEIEKSDDDSSQSSGDCLMEIEETKCEQEIEKDDDYKEQNGKIHVSALPELRHRRKVQGTRSQILSQYTKSRLSPQECYLKSLMPDVTSMNQRQFFNFRRGILNIVGKIKYRDAPTTDS